MTHSHTEAAALLVENLSLLNGMDIHNGVLDLACGEGRNGRMLVRKNIPVTFADCDVGSLAKLRDSLLEEVPGSSSLARFWQVDFEQSEASPLDGRQFDAILVFNYLHRPLMPSLRQAVRPGGLVFYETFTVDQAQFGRPKNPDFLLRPGELQQLFADWQILHSFEGEMRGPRRAKANLIARRP